MVTLRHDVDLATWFFGVSQEVFGAVGCGSHLELNVEDVAAMICSSTEGPLVEIHMNYLDDRPGGDS